MSVLRGPELPPALYHCRLPPAAVAEPTTKDPSKQRRPTQLFPQPRPTIKAMSCYWTSERGGQVDFQNTVKLPLEQSVLCFPVRTHLISSLPTTLPTGYPSLRVLFLKGDGGMSSFVTTMYVQSLQPWFHLETLLYCLSGPSMANHVHSVMFQCF